MIQLFSNDQLLVLDNITIALLSYAGSPVKYDTFKVFCMPMPKLGQMPVL